MIFANDALSQKLEGAFADMHALHAATTAKLHPELNAEAIDVAGGCAAFAGTDSFLSQLLGAGLSGPVASRELDKLEAFYRDRGMDCHVELSPFADESLLQALNQRHYHVAEYSSVIYLPLDEDIPEASPSTAFSITPTEDTQRWCDTVLPGFFEEAPAGEAERRDFSIFANIPNVKLFLAQAGSVYAGGAAVGIYGDVADLGYASTLPAHRGLGIQKALLYTRLNRAKAAGCRIATAITEPGSISQCNAEKVGFKVAYTRTKFLKSLRS